MGIFDRLRKPKATEPLPPSGCILLVGDDLATAEYVRGLLTEAHFEVCSGWTVSEALLMLDRGPGVTVDLIIGDFTHPEIDGKKFLQSARFRLGQIAMPPVVFLMDTASDEHLATEMGASDVLRKPVDAAALVECVQARTSVPPPMV